jgi:hypothetical protein
MYFTGSGKGINMYFTGSGKGVCHVHERSVERSIKSLLSSRLSVRENLTVSSRARCIPQNLQYCAYNMDNCQLLF